MKKILPRLLVLVLTGLSMPAYALTVTVDDNIADNTYMAAGSSLSGEFDINPAIPNTGEYNTPYDISGALTTFSFTDDGDLGFSYSTLGSYRYTSSSSGWFSSSYYYTRYKYNYYFDEYEEVQVNINGEYSTDGTDWYSMQYGGSSSYDGSSKTYPSCWIFCSYNYYYTSTYNVDSGYTGNIVIEQILSDDALAALAADGVIDFTLTATQGDVIYNSGSLTAEVNPNPNPVPEPSTWILLSSGLAGLAFWRRRK